MLRDHHPITISDFYGLWKRGENESCPRNHFTESQNVRYFHKGFRTRDGLTTWRGVANVVRMYNYVTQTGSTLLYLTSDGKIFHSISPEVTHGPILEIAAMTDFSFESFAGRAYLTPHNGIKGLEGEFVYVYNGDGLPARKTAGAGPIASPNVATSGAGYIEPGYHVFGIVYETNTGFLTKISPLKEINVGSASEINVTSIPSGPWYVTARHIVASKAIEPDLWSGRLEDYQLFFVPEGKINDNTTTAKTVSFFDADLLEDAWYLIDQMDEIPASAGLGVFNNHLLSWTTHDDISLVRVSRTGEPESISAIDGLIIFPPDGHPITNAQGFRDVLYIFKETKTRAWIDNGDAASSWPGNKEIDNGLGCLIHGMVTVLDSDGQNINHLMIVNHNGIMLFNGLFMHPELTWKVENLWKEMSDTERRNIQLLNDSINHLLYTNLPNGRILVGDYSDALDPKQIKWTEDLYNVRTSTITLVDKTRLLIGSDKSAV